ASNFDGVLGVLPDNETGEILITGDVKLNLLNSFKAGETINLQWQRLQTRTQQLDVAFKYPFLFDTPLGLDLAFNLYRRDTLFSQINATVGVDYFFLGSNSVKVYYQNLQANVISAAVFTVDEFIDSRTNLFGVGANVIDLDYRFNPRKGYFIEGRVAAGTKKIIENPEIEESAYEGIELESELYNANLNCGVYIPFGKRSAFLLRARGGAIINNNLFRNELFRIGGLKTLRGFDEQAIFASSYLISTLEYRFILEQNSNIFLFVDQAWYEDQSRANLVTDTPLGFGGGISFETGAGVFSLTYALGQQFDNNIELRNGKIHFGFTSFF
ncbi:MAG TPA: BamA/TamA family outer membrane protein, partial [Cryomorphaceae bacterium]|nr:BamA/TamA family outer membrane protein [Cryomorphaceae bacterium]